MCSFIVKSVNFCRSPALLITDDVKDRCVFHWVLAVFLVSYSTFIPDCWPCCPERCQGQHQMQRQQSSNILLQELSQMHRSYPLKNPNSVTSQWCLREQISCFFLLRCLPGFFSPLSFMIKKHFLRCLGSRYLFTNSLILLGNFFLLICT